jgi:DNA-binding NarL/FixJ family response regulator
MAIMNTGARQSLVLPANGTRGARFNGERLGSTARAKELAKAELCAMALPKARVFVAAENRLLREVLSRMMAKRGDLEVVGENSAAPFHAETVMEEGANILLLASRGNLMEDVQLIRRVRMTAPEVRILLIGATPDETEFLQCVRAGVNGYLVRDASAEDVLKSLSAVQAGEAVCSRSLCAVLFRHFEREAVSLPSASIHRRLGLTRREQQLIPLIGQGLTNKEIANHFCLSEQTVKNHLYRMKHKVGAEDRLGIVELCRNEGFLV